MLTSGVMVGGGNQRHRVGVLPGLPGTASSSANYGGEGLRSPLPQLEANHNNQLVPLNSKNLTTWNGSAVSEFRSSGQDGFTMSELRNVVNKISVIEEANKAILEEVYRLQTSVRATQLEKKGDKTDERKMQHELMQTIRASNDVVSELTSRMRRAEEKLHIDKETRKNMLAQTKQFEQALLNTQQESTSQREKQKAQIGELRHHYDDLNRKYDRSERTSSTLVDEFRQMKTKLEIQAMDFTHLQTELRQRSKRLEEDTKQAMLEARFQKDNNSQAEQNSLQTRQFFEVRINELRDVIAELRNRVGRAEAEAHSSSQHTSAKLNELQSSINDQSHKRQEDIQALERNRQEQGHVEENERMKLQGRIKEAVEEMSDKLLSKEVRLREEALQKFIEVERQVQREEGLRIQFEKQLREDNDTKWNLQQKLMHDELKAMKESRRSERTKHEANMKRSEELIHMLDRKLQREKKALEKVLLAEIQKREGQSTNILSQIDSLQEQLRVALSSLQQAIGGVQFQVSRDREQFSNEIKTQLSEEHLRVSRAVSDADSRLTALSARITQQDETYDVKINEMASSLRDKQTELLHDFQEWRENTNKDVANIQEILKELPQESKETQERVNRLKDDAETRVEIENEARRVDAEATESKIRMLAQRADTIEAITKEDHNRVDDLQQQLATAQGTLNQLTRTITDVRTSHNVRLNSETKMRLEEASGIKKELARLRMEIQPLLWKEAAGSRLFVKRGKSILNEWGIYQCARWYDIKMRWLRILQRARRRKRQERIANEHVRTPSPGLDEDYAYDLPHPSAEPGREAWKSQRTTPASFDEMQAGSRQSNLEPSQFDDNDEGFGLHGDTARAPSDVYGGEQSPASVRLGDEDDEDESADPTAWFNQDKVSTELDNQQHQGKPIDLTQRIDTPRRPSVPGSATQNVTPEKSATGSRQSLRHPNSRRAPSQASNPQQPVSRASKPPSRSQVTPRAPSNASNPRNSHAQSRRQSRQSQQNNENSQAQSRRQSRQSQRNNEDEQNNANDGNNTVQNN
ncbi:coiled-coil domain-containing protein 154-like isoform X2 [Styela clava]